MSDNEMRAVAICVCPVKDIECGEYPQNWCAECPKHVSQNAVAFVDAGGKVILKKPLPAWTDLYTRPALTDEQVRERFEAFARDELHYPTELTPSGQYECHTTRKAWQAWQSAIREAMGRGDRE